MNTSNRTGIQRFTGLALGLTLLSGALAPSAQAQGLRPATSPSVEVQDTRMEQADDRRDLVQLSAAINEWSRALRTGNVAMELDADSRIQAWLYQEMIESRQEALEAQREAAAARGDARRAYGSAAMTGSPAAGAAWQGASAAAQDDRMDAREKLADAQRVKGIYQEIAGMQPSFNARVASGGLYSRKATLYRQLQADALAELGEDREELYEDSVALAPVAPPAPASTYRVPRR